MGLIAEKEEKWLQNRLKYLSWDYFNHASDEERINQSALQHVLRKHAGAQFFGDCFVSEDAKIYTEVMHLRNKTFICGGAIIRHQLYTGDDCCIGSYSHLAGVVRLGSHVMIGGGVSIFGFNHGIEIDRPMAHQACQSRGIIIGDDCWIGANATIVDGVEIGAHSIVAAGAVVTKNFPEWSVIGGVPGRLIRNRMVPNDEIMLMSNGALAASMMENANP